MPDLKLKIVSSPEELRKAQRLRFEIFNLEMKSGLSSSFREGLDKDEFDEVCDHLVIEDRDNGRLIGTYRMLLGSRAKERIGFYSQKEFDLREILALQGESLEVGRSCVHKDYRNKAVLNLLWKGIAQYAKSHKVEYIFGCASIFTTDPKQVNIYSRMFKDLHYTSDLHVVPADCRHRIVMEEDVNLVHPERIFEELPVLFKGYLKLGLKVCGLPALDEEFGTTDFFIFLDIKRMNAAYKKRLFGDYLEHGSPGKKENGF